MKFDKVAFNGRERLLQQKNEGVKRRLVQFKLQDDQHLIYHNEPIWRNGVMVGHMTSGMFGHTLGAAVGMGYVKHSEVVTADFVNSGSYEIEIATVRVPAIASLQPFYDAKSERVKG